ncbi:MAG: hypothetical protein ABJB61_07360 [bacterium]
MRNRSLKRDWVLTEDSFNKLLDALDPDRQRAAEQYEHLRRSLTRYFDWRGLIQSERNADETIDRVARKLSDGGVVDELHTYALGVARNVALESLRLQQKEQVSLGFSPSLISDPREDEDQDRRFGCFENCLAQLQPAQRDLILAYYEGDKRTKIANRQKLADEAGMPIGRLRIQAHRIRERLDNCMKRCLASSGEDDAS